MSSAIFKNCSASLVLMCGIAGFNWDDKQLVTAMTNVMKYRGPDGSGEYHDEHVSLGHRRLAIIDLSSRGKQPMCNEDETVWITFNGEIYNFQEVRSKLKQQHDFKSETDTEVILHAYEEYGTDCLRFFNGDFAFCIYDKKKQVLFLARDRIGIKPLYFYNDTKTGMFVFASEIKAILEHKNLPRIVDPQVLNTYISFRYVLGQKTIFENISRLPAANYALYDLKKHKLTQHEYWDVHPDSQSNASEADLQKELLLLLYKGVERRLIADVPVGIFLSGGIDSSAIVAVMSQVKKKIGEEVKTFSVGFEHGGEFNELPFAKHVSEVFGTDHHEFVVKPDVVRQLPKLLWHLDEPMADPAFLPLYLLSQKARAHATVVLTGDGSDELFAGYDQYRFYKIASMLKHVPFSHKLSKAIAVVPEKMLNKVYKYSSAMGKKSFEKVDGMIAALKKHNPAKAYTELFSTFTDKERKELLGENYKELPYKEWSTNFFSAKTDFATQAMYFDLKNLLPEGYLMKTDKMTMAWSLEGRVPFLDHELVEFSCKIPLRLKLQGSTTKAIVRKSLGPLLPRELLDRKKQTFHVPIDQWLANDLGPMVDQHLSEESMRDLGLFNPEYVRKLFANFQSGKLFYARQMWNVLCFKVWHEQFMK